MGWVNIRQVLDTRLTINKVLFNNMIVLGLRVDEIKINQKLFRATLAQEVAKAIRENRGDGKFSREQRLALEEKVRLELLKAQPPTLAVYEIAWNLESGIVVFGSTATKMNVEFSELFSETFNVSIEPQFPFLRAQRWARRQKQEKELLELLPSPFSPDAPAEVVEVAFE